MKKMRSILALMSFLLTAFYAESQTKVRNVILMIPDGTSTPVLSLSRWYKYGACPADNCRLAVDRHLCGLVKTHNSDSPIGDSAPTGSTYATGYLSNTGFIATYPVSSGIEMDLVTVDTTRSYQPLSTLLEAAKQQGKSTGLVVTCHFPHATPADFSAHTPFRDRYDIIAKQMVYNRINYVLGGGTKYLSGKKREDSTDLAMVLKDMGYKVVTDREGFDGIRPSDSLVWGLFADTELPYDLDRTPVACPSLADMTKKAIQALSCDKEGFFLLVEGSKVDWAAHSNDPVGMVTEFLAFDAAVKEAMDFANRDGQTAVVICPDHGNSGISIGNKNSNTGYDALPINDLIEPIRRCTMTPAGIAKKIGADPDRAEAIFEEATGLCLNPLQARSIREFASAGKTGAIVSQVAEIITSNSYIGFTTTGHTGEDVFLAAYHPGGYRPTGLQSNVQINQYLSEISGTGNLDSLTSRFFTIDNKLLAGYQTEIRFPSGLPEKASVQYPSLVIRKEKTGSSYAVVDAYTDFVTFYERKRETARIVLGSVAVYVNTGKGSSHFYLPLRLKTELEKRL